MHCMSRCTENDLSCSQEPAAGHRQKISPHPTWSGFLVWGRRQVEGGQTPSYSPFQGIKHFSHCTVYVQKMRFHSKEGLQYLPPPARRAGHRHQSERQNSCGNSAVKVFMNVKAWLFPQLQFIHRYEPYGMNINLD